MVLNGKVFTGAHGVGTEIGHMCVKFDGEMCTCGNRGCWERYASATALIRMGREAAGRKTTPAGSMPTWTVSSTRSPPRPSWTAPSGDPDALSVFDRYVTYLCVGFVNLINLYDPEIIAIGGGVSAAGAFLLDAIRAKLPSMVFYKTMPYARVGMATLGNDAGIIGAAMLGK